MQKLFLRSLLYGSIFALAACVADAHENFKTVMQDEVGRPANHGSFIARYPELITRSYSLPNNNTEYEFKYIGDCVYFFEVDKKTNIIIDWHFKGSKENCSWNE